MMLVTNRSKNLNISTEGTLLGRKESSIVLWDGVTLETRVDANPLWASFFEVVSASAINHSISIYTL